MRNRFARAAFAVAALALVVGAAVPTLAQNGKGNGKGRGLALGHDIGVGPAGAPVVLRPGGPVPGQYIVVFEDEVANPRGLANALLRQNRLTPRAVYRTAVKGFAARMPEAVARRLASDPNVAYVEQDVYARADALVRGVDRIDADLNVLAQIDGGGGAVDVDVAVIDTGVHPHGDLNVHAFYNCIGGCSGNGNPGNAFDDNGHGSHVAGTIGALDNGTDFGDWEVVGVAPGARIWGFKVLDAGGSGSFSDVISAIDAVTANAAQIEVANMSLSGTGFLQSLRTAIQASVDAGVVYVVAAGNALSDVYGGNGQLDTSSTCKGRYCRNADDTIPAAYPEVMTVSAMADFDGTEGGLLDQTVSFSSCTHTGDDVFACFTNYSDRDPGNDNPLLSDGESRVSSPGGAIDVAGPGVMILSTLPGGYGWSNGTSMASPHVAGAVALHIARFGRATDGAEVADIRQALIDAAQAQSQWGPADTEDPDGNAEGLVYAGVDSSPSANAAPTVEITSPADGSDFESGTSIAFAGSADDAEDGGLTANLIWTSSLDGQIGTGGSFSAVLSDGNHTITAEAVDSEGASGSESVGISVEAAVANEAPAVSIADPADGSHFDSGTSIGFSGSAGDTEDGDLTAGLVWTSSLDGQIGTGGSFSTAALSVGTHAITAAVTDSGSLTGEDSISVTIDPLGGGAAIVESVCYSGNGGRSSDKHLISTVTVTDGTTAVGGATVSLRIDSTSGISQSGTGTTDAAGEVAFSWNNADTGDSYSTVVEAVNGDADIATPENSVAWPEGNGACF